MGQYKTFDLKIDSDLLTAAKVYAKECNIPLSAIMNEAIATYLNTKPEVFVKVMKSKQRNKASKTSLQRLIKKLEAQDIIEALEDLDDISTVRTRRSKTTKG